MRNGKLAIACIAAVLAVGQVQAGVIKFDDESDLSDNFIVEQFIYSDTIVIDKTIWKPGYAAQGIYEGSDGGFVHGNISTFSNFFQFRNGPVFLKSLDISSQYAGGGLGVAQAAVVDQNYHLRLYDQDLNLIVDQALKVSDNGAWGTVTLNLPGVLALRIDPTYQDPVKGLLGWYPSIDNIRFEAATTMPEPTSLGLWSSGLAIMTCVRLRSRSSGAR